MGDRDKDQQGRALHNWTTGTNTYSIALHCTSTTNDGWLADNYPF